LIPTESLPGKLLLQNATIKMLGGKKGTVKILQEGNFNHKKSNKLVQIPKFVWS
jgi:hypothetical protein